MSISRSSQGSVARSSSLIPSWDSTADVSRCRRAGPSARSDARQFALDHRVVLVETSAGIPVDISLACLPFEARVIARSTPFDVQSDTALVTCSAEDLVVLKAFAGRVQDWLDIEGIIVRQGARLNRTLVLEELVPLLDLKDDLESEAQLRRLLTKHPIL